MGVFRLEPSGVTNIAFSRDGKLLAAGCFDNTVNIWNCSREPMKRFWRNAWNGSVAVSAALCVILLLAWVGNYQRFTGIHLNQHDTIFLGGSAIEFNSWAGERINWTEHAWRQVNFFSVAYLLVQRDYALDTPKPVGHLIVIVPYWWSIPPFMILPAVFLLGRLRRRRSPGSCSACGYDLRATPERCPECGRLSSKTSSPG